MPLVEKFYRDLNEFSLSIENWKVPSEGITVLWGPSGAGKSTLVHGLLGLDEKALVKWFFKGEEFSQKPVSERGLGVVFQDFGLFLHMNVKKNILFPVNKKKHPHWKEDFHQLVDLLELEPLLFQAVGKLSGGEKQRVALARALIYRPVMLFLDEPFSFLDERIRQKIRLFLKQICEDRKCPILLITHDRSDVEVLSTKVSEMEKGRIVREGTAQDFLSRFLK